VVDPVLHPYEIVKSERWSFGLFTSFTLNLGFFETVVYDAWRGRRSQELVVVVDRKGYAQSLADHRAAGAGQRYKIVPVAVNLGVFHPKVGFLANNTHCILMVGSGNLSFGGWGKNFELLDVVDSSETATPFVGFRDFLLGLNEIQDVSTFRVADTEWITTALSCLPKPSPSKDEGPIFLHSLRESISSQLKKILNNQGVESLSVLSPFHDQDGESVCELAAAINSKQTRVIASVGPKGPVSSFPFGLKLKTKVDPFILVTDDKRPVHAKWIEITCKDSKVVLTGSVNATRPALSTTHNVEAGILRHQAVGFPGPFKLKACPLPTRTRFDLFEDESPSRESVVYVTLDPSNRLRGTLLGKNVAGQWEARIVRPAGNAIPPEQAPAVLINVTEEGEFVSDVARFTNELLEFEPGLQLRLTRGQNLARGWIHSELALRSSTLSRLASAVVGLFQNSGVTSDLREFVVEVLKCVKSGMSISQKTSSQAHKQAPNVGFGSKVRRRHDRSGQSQPDLITMLFERLGHDLTRARSSRDFRPNWSQENATGIETDSDDDQTDATAKDKLKDQISLTLEDMHERMELAARHLSREDPLCATLLIIWLDCSFAVYAKSGDRASAIRFLKRWTAAALSRINLSRSKPIERGLRSFLTALRSNEQHSMRLKSILVAALCIEAVLEGEVENLATLRRTREYIEDYFRDFSKAFDSNLLPDSSSEFVTLLLGDAGADYVSLLTAVEGVSTRRSILSSALKRFREGGRFEVEPTILQSDSVRELVGRIQQDLSAKVAPVGRGASACPSCHMSLASVVQDLNRDMIVSCPSCHAILIRTLS
jgi:hypothetical protein